MHAHPSAVVQRLAAVALIVLAVVALSAAPATADGPDVEISYEKYVLDNGLTLIVHRDPKAPIVAVNVWYHVGSKNEKPGKTGFAHLFEHLMFNGSESYDDDYFKPLDEVGATEVNGTTNFDRTNYFQNVPVSALDRALFLESDRMGHLLGAITQDKLDEQRGVVQNEKRQGENQPYGLAYEKITEGTYPQGHPYSWTVIGSMEDLDAASLEDVHAWFEEYYGAANAVLVVAGDVDPQEVKAKVEHYFGDVPPGPPVARFDRWVARREEPVRQRLQDNVPQARVYTVWNVPGYGTEDADLLDLLSDVLARGKSSRLYKRLVYDERLATDVSASLDVRELGSHFTIRATAVPGGDLAAVETAVREELARLLTDGPSADEVERAASRQIAAFVRGAERIGGFGGKSDVLAECQVYTGDPECWKTRLARLRGATPERLAEIGRRWLRGGDYTLEIHPYPKYAAAAEGADRSALPQPGPAPQPDFPALRRAELSNGLRVVLAERHAMPLVQLTLMVDSGYAADPAGRPGTASFAMEMLDEGAGERDALEISDELARLGATLSTGADLDMAQVSMSALRSALDPSLDLLADIALHPTFPAGEVERLRAERIAAIGREKVNPVQIALRTLPRLLYGDGHAYATSFTGTGTEASVAAITRADLAGFHATWFKADNATLVVVGDVTLGELLPKLEARFGAWQGGAVPTKNVAPVEPGESRVYLVDRPGSIQSVILAGHVIPPRANPREPELQAVADVLGGGFVSRLNMNLREDKSWAYFAAGFILDAAGQRPLMLVSPVQSDQTGPALAEMLSEVRELAGDRPVTAEELERYQRNEVLSLPGSWETGGAVSNAIEELVRFDLPDDYWSGYPAELEALELPAVRAAARAELHPESLVWVVVGDRETVEPQLREAGFEDVRRIDADGRPLGDG